MASVVTYSGGALTTVLQDPSNAPAVMCWHGDQGVDNWGLNGFNASTNLEADLKGKGGFAVDSAAGHRIQACLTARGDSALDRRVHRRLMLAASRLGAAGAAGAQPPARLPTCSCKAIRGAGAAAFSGDPTRGLDWKYALEYAFVMERVTASFDRKTVQEIRRVAGRRGVSAFLQVAARERLAKLRELALIDELDAKYGAPSAAVRREVDAAARRIFRR